MKSMTAEERAIYARDKCTCRYCDLRGLDNFDVWLNLTIDHIEPKGGKSRENKAVACHYCNCIKGNRYEPKGNTREEKIADARQYIQKHRDEWRPHFDRTVQEISR